MTVSTLTNTVVYRGNGSATEFAVPFKVFDVDHLQVTRREFDTSDTVHTYIGTDYSYDGLGEDSGTLTLDGDPLSSDFELVIKRIVPYTQELDIVNAGGFYPDTVERQLDEGTMQVQQVKDMANRALKVRDGQTALEVNLVDHSEGQVLAIVNDVIKPIDNDTGSAANYAAAAADSAEAAAASEDAAEASATAAANSAGAAASSETQAGIYLAGFNTSQIFASEVLGRAAVADGEEFWVTSANGLLLYRRIDAVTVSTLLMTIPSLAATGPRQFIKCVASTGGYSNNDFGITPVDTTVTYSGDGTQYVWVCEAPNDNTVGSGGVSIEIKNGAGAVFGGAGFSVRTWPDLATLTPLAYRRGDLMFFRRATAGESGIQPLLWLRPTDTATAGLAKAYASSGSFGLKTSTVHPLRYLKRHTLTHDIVMRFDEDFYLGGESRRASDEIRIVEFDQVQYAGLSSGNALFVNSYMTMARGLACNDLNMQMFDIVGGLVADVGRSPTAIEPPIHGGDAAESTANARVSGATHNNYTSPVTTLTLTYADANTSEVNTNVTIDPGAAINTQKFGDYLVKNVTIHCTDNDGEVYCQQTQNVTYDPIGADGQIRIESTFDFTSGTTVTTPGMIRGFGMLAAFTDMNRCQAVVNGVAGPIHTIDTRDDAVIQLGYPEEVWFWHSDFPEKQIRVKNKLGYGYTHKVNDAAQANGAYQTYVESFADGPYVKMYGALFGDHGAGSWTDMTGKIVTTDFSIAFFIAPERT